MDPVSAALSDVPRRAADDETGTVADYIPELANADSDSFGIAAASVAGHVYETGDSRAAFTVQPISNPFVYAMALRDLGLDVVHASVGIEPSGAPFDALSLDADSRPADPMINAGAIITSALIGGLTRDDRFDRIRDALSAFAGRALEFDSRVWESERSTGNHNRALATQMKDSGMLTREVDEATDVYFRQCAVLVTAADVAVMSATLANGGVNPLNGKAMIDASVARRARLRRGRTGGLRHSKKRPRQCDFANRPDHGPVICHPGDTHGARAALRSGQSRTNGRAHGTGRRPPGGPRAVTRDVPRRAKRWMRA